MCREKGPSVAYRYFMPTYPQASSQRAQEVQQVLLGPLAQVAEVVDHTVRLRAEALVLTDRDHQVVGAAVVQEENPLPEAPQRRGAEFPRARLALADAVRKPHA